MLKSSLFTLIALMLSAGLIQAQNCDLFMQFKEGVTTEYQMLDKKGKLSGTTQNTVKNLKSAGSETTAVITQKMTDEKGKEVTSGTYEVICEGNAYRMDVSSLLPAGLTDQFGENMEVTFEGDGLVMPTDLSVGKTFPSSSNEINFASGGMNLMSMKMDITDHKVESKEEVSVPAGKFDAYKVVYNMTTKMMGANSTFKVVSWYADGVGMVKQESYDKKGKLDSTMLLSKFEGS